jgi:monooxygenase
VVTDTIADFTADGIVLDSGRILPADVIVAATGLQLNQLGDAAFSIGGRSIDFTDRVMYKGMLFSGVPNLAVSFGYVNASWTLRADLTCEYLCHIINHMHRHGNSLFVPTLRPQDAGMQLKPWLDQMSSGYIKRAAHMGPKQGQGPWRNTQNYFEDKQLLGASQVTGDGVLVFR